MRMSFINPNQLQHCGVSVSDDPTDSSTRAFGITVENVVHIEFEIDGTTVYYFETRVPTQYKLEN